MSASIRVNAQQKTFQYAGYSVLIRERYMPWGDLPGKPSFFDIFFIERGKENILSLIESVDWLSLDQNSLRFLVEQGLKFASIQNTYVPHNINWAIEEAKHHIQEYIE